VATANIVIMVYKILLMIYSCTFFLLYRRGGDRNFQVASIFDRR